MPQQVSDIAEAVRLVRALVAQRPALAGDTRVIAIDGPSGAGKSTFAARLSTALGGDGRPAPVVRLDDVYPGWDGLEDGVRRVLMGVLEPLSRGQGATLRRHDWVLGVDGDCYDVPAAAVVLLEGCGAGARMCSPFLSALVWVDAPQTARHDRAMARDGDAYRPHWRRWAAQEDAHFAREGTAARADLWLWNAADPADGSTAG
ncbi:dephospho-CoA kinase [Angustibacter sp. McL0619]|uniref:dephospho-CoA kinase n=1 Tax=Angustibacter sp. McL0619 TaxID=3415676 RepID=UPI003CF8B5A6